MVGSMMVKRLQETMRFLPLPRACGCVASLLFIPDRDETNLIDGLSWLQYDPTSGLLQYGRASVFQHLPDPSPASLLSSQDPGHLVDSVSSGSTHPSPLVPSSWRKNLPHRGLHRWDDQLHDLVVDLFFSYFNKYGYFLSPPRRCFLLVIDS